MKRSAYQIIVSVSLVVVMVAFLSTIFFVNANQSFAASSKQKSSPVLGSSAVGHTEAQIKQLEGALNITEPQKELWNNLTQVMRENAKDIDTYSKERADSTKTMNAVEHIKIHSQVTETHLNQMKKLIPPFEALYASMSDEQKKITDTTFRTGKHGKSKKK